LHATGLEASESQALLDDYTKLLGLANPETIPYPSKADVLAARRSIAHQADVPVLLSAIRARPHWLLTHNTKHFNPSVASRNKLQIGTPADFFRALTREIS
jgi:hypothetical protein